MILTKSFPAAIRRVREHKALGHRTVLITGALDFVVEPLRPLFDEIIAAHMDVRADGTFSGQMTEVPPTGESRAQLLEEYCAAEGLKMSESCAYADSTSDLPMLEADRVPGGGQPRDPPRRHRPQARLVGRELVEGTGVSPQPFLPVAATRYRRPPRATTEAPDESAPRSLQIASSPASPRRASRAAINPGSGAAYGPRSTWSTSIPRRCPDPGWRRHQAAASPASAASDLSTIDGIASRYFESIVSFPFVPGHEVVADAADGRRVVLEPVLGCVTRGIEPVCPSCARGELGNCERLAFGELEPGLQTGFCCDTGGG